MFFVELTVNTTLLLYEIVTLYYPDITNMGMAPRARPVYLPSIFRHWDLQVLRVKTKQENRQKSPNLHADHLL